MSSPQEALEELRRTLFTQLSSPRRDSFEDQSLLKLALAPVLSHYYAQEGTELHTVWNELNYAQNDLVRYDKALARLCSLVGMEEYIRALMSPMKQSPPQPLPNSIAYGQTSERAKIPIPLLFDIGAPRNVPKSHSSDYYASVVQAIAGPLSRPKNMTSQGPHSFFRTGESSSVYRTATPTSPSVESYGSPGRPSPTSTTYPPSISPPSSPTGVERSTSLSSNSTLLGVAPRRAASVATSSSLNMPTPYTVTNPVFVPSLPSTTFHQTVSNSVLTPTSSTNPHLNSTASHSSYAPIHPMALNTPGASTGPAPMAIMAPTHAPPGAPILSLPAMPGSPITDSRPPIAVSNGAHETTSPEPSLIEEQRLASERRNKRNTALGKLILKIVIKIVCFGMS